MCLLSASSYEWLSGFIVERHTNMYSESSMMSKGVQGHQILQIFLQNFIFQIDQQKYAQNRPKKG